MIKVVYNKNEILNLKLNICLNKVKSTSFWIRKDKKLLLKKKIKFSIRNKVSFSNSKG